MTVMDDLPPETIGNIMDVVIDAWVRRRRSKTRPKFVSSPWRSLGLRDLANFAMSSKHHYAIYKDREYVTLKHVLEQLIPRGPGMCDFVIRMAALIFTHPKRPFQTNSERSSFVESTRRALEYLNEYLHADVHTLLTPKLLRHVVETYPSLDRHFLPTPCRMLHRYGALLVESDIVHEAQRATPCCILATMELLNWIILQSIYLEDFWNEDDSPEDLSQVEAFNESFRDAFEENGGRQKVVCVWQHWMWSRPPQFRFVCLYQINIVTSTSAGDV